MLYIKRHLDNTNRPDRVLYVGGRGGVRSMDDESGGRPPVSASIVSEKTEL